MAEIRALSTDSVRSEVTNEEWQARVDLAALYRLVALNGWDDLIYTHISARVPGTESSFLINPLGLLFEEITASSLVKIDVAGNKLLDTPYEVNRAGFTIHSAIHEAREDAHWVIHLHTDYGIAVSIQKNGLLPLCQTSIFPHALIAYHDYEGVAVRPDEKERLVADMGGSMAMILRNHGTLTVGATAEQAYLSMFFLERACKIQILAQSSGQELTQVSDEAYRNALTGGEDVNEDLTTEIGPWSALMRKLDRLDPGFRE